VDYYDWGIESLNGSLQELKNQVRSLQHEDC
jgi:hypothetical protein